MPRSETSSTGRRPTRSEIRPRIGPAKNCARENMTMVAPAQNTPGSPSPRLWLTQAIQGEGCRARLLA